MSGSPTSPPPASARSQLLQAACDPRSTPFDYIVVGSGAGGGPLAARLAEEGCRVLVIEAGDDELTKRGAGSIAATDLEAPLLHGNSVEDPAIQWDFRVRHYADPKQQARDTKAVPDPESPDRRPAVNKPRTAALGGCTAHHAMITAYGCDDAWEGLRQLTGDESWHPTRMRHYFQRIENCEYRRPFTTIGRVWRQILAFFAIKPQAVLQGEHGEGGWLNTAVTDPTTALGDHELLRVLAGAFDGAERAGIAKPAKLAAAIAEARLDKYLDVNDAGLWREHTAEGVRLIPLGVKNGRRHGVRERLLDVHARYPDRLVFATSTHATRLQFAKEEAGSLVAPRVIGVEWTAGNHLYKASPLHGQSTRGESGCYYARREVILAGGTFNSPQLLMLSGIGPKAHLEANGIGSRVDLPGVGSNLQDRYEVCVVSELAEEFSTLKGVGFDGESTTDPQLAAWRRHDPESLYACNGGAFAILKKSKPSLDYPDLFLFAAPAMFRGYYPGWSGDLLRAPRHGSAPGEIPGAADRRNQLSWVILKAHSTNDTGTVRLRSGDPFATPVITHHHFAEGAPAGSPAALGAEADLDALSAGITFARTLNAGLGNSLAAELWPGAAVADGSAELETWIRDEAWGHHPSGTCRIGSDTWQPDPAELEDVNAVLDSRFRVHGVRGLRVVDASIFPKIPGYFIATPIFCASEKAADDILADFELYPRSLERAEAAAIATRREVAGRIEYDGGLPSAALASPPAASTPVTVSPPPAADPAAIPRTNSASPAAPPLNTGVEGKLPRDTIGLALSGGGIRSATFCLGILQGLARLKKLRQIDLLSTASGGGYIGSFLGRLFHRKLVTVQHNPAVAVEQILRDSSSAPVRWLRSQADYIGASGPSDDRQNLAVCLRNLLTIHLILGVFFIAIFGGMRITSDWLGLHGFLPDFGAQHIGVGYLSPWWMVPIVVLVCGIVPLGLGYWATPRRGRSEPFNPVTLLVAIAVLTGSAYAFSETISARPALVVVVAVVTLALLWLEGARFGSRLPASELGERGLSLPTGLVIRNRLTRALAETLVVFIFTAGFVVLDSAARTISFLSARPEQLHQLWAGVASFISALFAIAAFVGPWVQGSSGKKNVQASNLKLVAATAGMALIGVSLLLFSLDLAIHSVFDHGGYGWLATLAAVVFSVLVARGFAFVNLSSLHATYAARLARTFLGASNPERIYGNPQSVSEDIKLSHPDDDLQFHEYHPEVQGGPLHFINTCLNETVDYASLRDLRSRNGISLACGPCGVSVGRRMHALWDPVKASALQFIELSVGSFHAFRSKDGKALPVEALSLGDWMAISGAAASTGDGRNTTASRSMLAGLTNVRLGYWWDTDPKNRAAQREYWPNLWESLKRLPARLFRVQAMLLTEFRARFYGPNNRLWYLSDGGHFDNSGVYEFIRRRVPFIITADAGSETDFSFENTAELVRLARIDFGAEIEFLVPDRKAGAGWTAFGAHAASIPSWIKDWIVPDGVGALTEVSRPKGRHAALARISYAGNGPDGYGWLLLLKSGLTGDESLDVLSYNIEQPNFPNDSVIDQSYDESQWESYRRLGEHVALGVLK